MSRCRRIIAGAIAAPLLALLVAAGADAAAMKIWWDTFEDGNTTGWTINQNVASITVDATQANTGTRSLKVSANQNPPFPNGNGANATSRVIFADFTQDYTVQFAFRYASFHWNRILLLGHIRLLVDQAGLPLLYDPVGDNSFPGNPVSPRAFNSFLAANTWGWITVHCRPSLRQYTVFVNGVLMGTVTYQAGLVPRSTLFFEENYSSTNYLNAWFDDFSVWAIQDARQVPFASVGFVVDAENTALAAQPPDVPYHSQFNVPDIAGGLAEPCSPPRANRLNGRCVVAGLDMIFDRFETLPPANVAPNPQEEIAAAANTSDRPNCVNGGPGNWFGTYFGDGRRAAHFSAATAALTAVRAGCPPQGCPGPGAGANGYTWRDLGYAAANGVWTDLAPGDTVDVNGGIFPWTLETLLASGYPLLIRVPPGVPCDFFDRDYSRGDLDCGPDQDENTVIGHCVVLTGYDNLGGRGGNPRAGPAFQIHDPARGKYLWMAAQFFWDSYWSTKEFVFAAPWEFLWLSPPKWTFRCRQEGTLLVTYPGPKVLTGLYPVANARARVTAMTYLGLDAGEVATHNLPGVARMGDWAFTTWKLKATAQPPCPQFCVFIGAVSYDASGVLAPAAASESYAAYADRVGGSGRETKVMTGSLCAVLVDPGFRKFPPPGRWWDRPGSSLGMIVPGGPTVGLTAAISNQGDAPIPGGTVCRFYYGEPTVAERAGSLAFIGQVSVPPLAPSDTATVGPLPWSKPPANGFGEPYFSVVALIVASGDPASSPWPQEENNVAALSEHDIAAQRGQPVSLSFLIENPEPGPKEVVLQIDREGGAAAWTVEVRDALDQPIPPGQPIALGGGSSMAARLVVTAGGADTVGRVHVDAFLYEPGAASTGVPIRQTGGVTATLHLPPPATSVADGPAGPRPTLSQNRPNPFGGSTTIAYAIVVRGPVRLRIFDLQGRLVRTLVAGERAAGRHEIAWKGDDDRGVEVARGIYFYRLESPGEALTRKLLFLK